MAVTDQFEVQIPSDTAEGQAVQERICQLMEQAEFPARDVFGVRLALEEAIVNAIKHGNGMDPNKSVRIRCVLDGEKIHIEIEDQGPGFSPSDVPDPTADENLERPCGRGIMLMKAFMNHLAYNEQGNMVVMEKIRGVDVEAEDD